MHSTLSLYALLFSVGTAAAQDLVYYKFDEGCRDRVINYVATSPHLAEGSIRTTLPGGPAGAWTPGVFGSALAGTTFGSGQYVYVDTGWGPGTIVRSLSYAFWMKVHGTQPAPSLSHVFGGPLSSDFRLFTDTSGFLFTASWSGTAGPTVTSRTNFWNLAIRGWVHVAFVIDATALTATYYVNGTAETPTTIASGANWSAGRLYVGSSNTTNFNVFDLDEFLFVNRALTPDEVARLQSSPLAAEGSYGGSSCGLALFSNHRRGPASLRNSGYELLLESVNPVAFSLGFGTNRCTAFGVPLPFDLGNVVPYLNGCFLNSSLNAFIIGGAKPSGGLTIPLPIPGSRDLLGLTLYAQALGNDLVQNRFVSSNAFSLSLGN